MLVPPVIDRAETGVGCEEASLPLTGQSQLTHMAQGMPAGAWRTAALGRGFFR
jgi:hypothetical protein